MTKKLNGYRTENYLNQFRKKLKDLFRNLSFLGTGSDELGEINQEIQQLLVQATLLNIINKKHVIAVSGFQGSGKSTLLKWFLFNFEKTSPWFPQNQGLGENLPILITFDDELSEVEGKLHKIDTESGQIGEETINSKQSKEYSKKPKNNHVYIELSVPLPKFKDGKELIGPTSLLLLPGIEEIIDEDRNKVYRQEHMKTALTACANTILVLDPDGYSRQSNQKTLEYISNVFGSSKILIALSRSDTTDDNNAELTQKVRDDLNIYKKDRILATGANYNLAETWRPKLRDMINRYGAEQTGLRSSQHKAIKKMLGNCDKIIRRIKRISDEQDFEEKDKTQKVHDYLKEFGKAEVTIKKAYIEVIDKVLNDIASDAQLEIDKNLKYQSNWEKIKLWGEQKLTGPAPIIDIITAAKDAWKEKLEAKYGSEQAAQLIILNKTINKLPKSLYTEDLPQNSTDGDLQKLQKASIGKDATTEWDLEPDMIQNIQYLAGNDLPDSQKLNGNKYNKAMEKIPYLILESSRLQLTIDPQKLTFDQSLWQQFEDYPEMERELGDWLDSFSEKTRGIIWGALGILGADYLPDGDVDVFKGLAAMFGNAETAEAAGVATGSAAIGSAIVGIAAIGIAYSVNQAAIEANLMKIREQNEIIHCIRNEAMSDFRNKFDEKMGYARENLQSRIEDLIGVGVNTGRVLNLEIAIYKMEEINFSMRKSIRNEA